MESTPFNSDDGGQVSTSAPTSAPTSVPSATPTPGPAAAAATITATPLSRCRACIRENRLCSVYRPCLYCHRANTPCAYHDEDDVIANPALDDDDAAATAITTTTLASPSPYDAPGSGSRGRKRKNNLPVFPPPSRTKRQRVEIRSGPCVRCESQGLRCNADHALQLECGQCTNLRAKTDPQHCCTVQGVEYWQVRHPALRNRYEPVRGVFTYRCRDCTATQGHNAENNGQCDADPQLKIGCSMCRIHGRPCLWQPDSRLGNLMIVLRERPSKGDFQDNAVQFAAAASSMLAPPAGNNMSEMDAQQQQQQQQQIAPVPVPSPWWRRKCAGCLASGSNCSWLSDVRKMDYKCDACIIAQTPCLDAEDDYRLVDVVLVEGPLSPEHPRINDPPVISRAGRHRCTQFAGDGAEKFACVRCHAWGTPCFVPPTNVYQPPAQQLPFIQPEIIGWGTRDASSVEFRACSSCEKKLLWCDRQRPCQSCVSNGTDCDMADRPEQQQQGCWSRERLGQLGLTDCGPSYYMALGYHPDALGADRDNVADDAIVGPATPLWGLYRSVEQAGSQNSKADKGFRGSVQIRSKAAHQTAGLKPLPPPAPAWRRTPAGNMPPYTRLVEVNPPEKAPKRRPGRPAGPQAGTTTQPPTPAQPATAAPSPASGPGQHAPFKVPQGPANPGWAKNTGYIFDDQMELDNDEFTEVEWGRDVLPPFEISPMPMFENNLGPEVTREELQNFDILAGAIDDEIARELRDESVDQKRQEAFMSTLGLAHHDPVKPPSQETDVAYHTSAPQRILLNLDGQEPDARLRHPFVAPEDANRRTEQKEARRRHLLTMWRRPGLDMLREIPDEEDVHNFEQGGSCVGRLQGPVREEPKCGKACSKDQYCGHRGHVANLDAARNRIGWTCDTCDMISRRNMAATDKFLTRPSILSMRSYACDKCKVIESTEPGVVGMHETRPITGCRCGEKLVGRRLCDTHRYLLTPALLLNCALINEWKTINFRPDHCMFCKSSDGKPYDGSMSVFVCSNCQTRVVDNGATSSTVFEGYRSWLGGDEALRRQAGQFVLQAAR